MNKCTVLLNRKKITKPCINADQCEICPVPQTCGFIYNTNKARWEQVFREETHKEAAERICRETLKEDSHE